MSGSALMLRLPGHSVAPFILDGFHSQAHHQLRAVGREGHQLCLSCAARLFVDSSVLALECQKKAVLEQVLARAAAWPCATGPY